MTIGEIDPVDSDHARPPVAQLALSLVPPVAQLAPRFDPARLQADLHRLNERTWSRQRSYADDGTITEAVIDWRCLPLRSVGGDPDRMDPGGPGREEFADTHWVARAPYLGEVLERIPAQLRSARLLALGPGAASWEHCDTKYGPAWGTARLHVPITTTPGATLFMEGTPHQWQPGTLWFADFSRMHRVENVDEVSRVHLVVDALVSDELLDLFPEDYRALLPAGEVLVNRWPVAIAAAESAAFRVQFKLPTSFTNWEEEDGQFLRTQSSALATIDLRDARLTLSCDGRPTATLVHIGDGEFRFAGWTDERTLQIIRTPQGPTVTLRSRKGAAVRELTISAESLP